MGFEELSSAADIIFGGTFDPPHVGHRLLVHHAQKRFPQARVRVIPAPKPAGAHGVHKQPLASFQQRFEMTELLFSEEIAQGTVTVDPIEAGLPAPHFTLHTLDALAQRFPRRSWACLMGWDQWLQFAAWHQPRAIVERASLIVMERTEGVDFGASVDQLAHTLGLRPEARGPDAWNWAGMKTGVYHLGPCVSPAASRLIREDWPLAARKGWISPEVAAYIKRQGLYPMKEA